MILLVKKKAKKIIPTKAFLKTIYKLYSVINYQFVHFNKICENYQKKIFDLETSLKTLTKKHEQILIKDEELIEKLINLDHQYKETAEMLETYQKNNNSLKIVENFSEESTAVLDRQKEYEEIEKQMKKYLTINLFFESQDNSRRSTKDLAINDNSCITISKSPCKYIDVAELNEKLEKKEKIIKEKVKEINFIMDLVYKLRKDQEKLQEENVRLKLIHNNSIYKEKEYAESESSLRTFQEISEILCSEPSEYHFLVKPKQEHTSSSTQTVKRSKARDSCCGCF